MEEQSDKIDKDERKRVVVEGELMELVINNSRRLLVHRSTKVPRGGRERNPGQYDTFLKGEPRRTYLPDLLRPSVLECAH